ncbi:MAG: ASKHA domain-containing protein [Fusicatenibacter sp.]|nr:ASKHA domain-containing protein [Lachnospiraceae bacterium]MDY2937898.1 ASKHA domain-containing protein [Fusicatenibacter sp.]
MKGLSRKIYLEMQPPTEEDNRSDAERILNKLDEKGYTAKLNLSVLRKLYPICERADYQVTVSVAWNGTEWIAVDLEPGNTAANHYGLAVDLGSTTVSAQLICCETGKLQAQATVSNHQIKYGTDILTRIFYCKDQPEHLEEIRIATVSTIRECLQQLEAQTGIPAASCIQMVVAGNTTMIHFLIGMDPFCIFSSPYAVHQNRPGFLPGQELGIPISGYVFLVPSKSNYLGGDIISGMIATELYRKDEISVFFDIGTNGELVIGNKEFLLCGAGAAGPALEGGVVRTGMRAEAGAVDSVKIDGTRILCHVIGGGTAKGICGSGIIDLLAELFLHGWIDFRGRLQIEKGEPISIGDNNELRVQYSENLFFYQSDIDEFLRTKAAAYTMVSYMLKETGISMEDVSNFYVAGAFGTHVNKESAITIGLYPDIDRERLINAGNTSLEGASQLLLNLEIQKQIDPILDHMVYIQFGAVTDFLQMMVAAQAIPHTDLSLFPSVPDKLSVFRNFNK